MKEIIFIYSVVRGPLLGKSAFHDHWSTAEDLVVQGVDGFLSLFGIFQLHETCSFRLSGFPVSQKSGSLWLEVGKMLHQVLFVDIVVKVCEINHGTVSLDFSSRLMLHLLGFLFN